MNKRLRPYSSSLLGENSLGWGEPGFKVPQSWGASDGYVGVSPSRAPGVDLGGILGFMQEVY
jgi:hypothetical protein